MKKKAVLFDMDGTILDSLQDLMDSANYALEGTDSGPHSLDDYRYFVGGGARNLITRALTGSVDPEGEGIEINEALVDEILVKFVGHYETNKTNKTAPYQGILELLHQLKDKGYVTAVMSNKYDSAVKELANLYFPGLLSAAIGEGGDVRPKPEPDGIYKGLDQFGLSVDEAIYIGDSDVDVITAHNAKMFCVGVTWGFRGRKELTEAGADAIIDEPKQIWDYI